MQTVKQILNSKGELEFVGLDRREQLALSDHVHRRWNAVGDVSSSDLGYKYFIDTLSYIKTQLITQKFYTAAPSEFFPVVVGEGGWSDDIFTNREFLLAGDFEDGVVEPGNGEQRTPSVDAGISPISIAVNMWKKATVYNIAEIQQALMTSRWNLAEGRERARYKNFQLGIQSIAFLGSKTNPTRTPGLLTNTDVNTDTSTITKPISEMDATEFQEFIRVFIAAYFTNSNKTVLPDTLVIPMSDWLGLDTATSAGFPIGSKREYIIKAFQSATRNPNFQILPLAYCDSDENAVVGINKQVYMLYRNDAETLNMNIPLAYTLGAPNTGDNFTFISQAYCRYTGVQVARPLEVLKFEFTLPS